MENFLSLLDELDVHLDNIFWTPSTVKLVESPRKVGGFTLGNKRR